MTDPLSAITEFRDKLREMNVPREEPYVRIPILRERYEEHRKHFEETNDPRLKELEKFYVPIDNQEFQALPSVQ